MQNLCEIRNLQNNSCYGLNTLCSVYYNIWNTQVSSNVDGSDVTFIIFASIMSHLPINYIYCAPSESMSGNGIPDRYTVGESIGESVATRRNFDEYFLCDYMYTLETRLLVFSCRYLHVSIFSILAIQKNTRL